MPDENKDSSRELSDVFAPKFHSAELVFACVMLVLSLFLASQYDVQTRILEGKELIAQPGFWSWLSVFGMLAFGLPYTFIVVRKFQKIESPEPIVAELTYWVLSTEFALWFLAYVLSVPKIGYLPSTLLFSLALTYRTGYRNVRYFFWAAAFSIISVLLFKSFLGVSIPGGEVYETFPSQIRNFLIMYF